MSKFIFYFFAFCVLYHNVACAQILERFDDTNFSQNPQWTGNDTEFIINTGLQLQSNSTLADHSFYLSTPIFLTTSSQWEFFVRLNFNPSSANYVDAFLSASANDLTAASTFGYFVRIGNTDDEISLYKKSNTGIITKIIDGINGTLNKSNNLLKIKVVRNSSNIWSLFSDVTGTGNSFVNQGSGEDAAFGPGNYFGFLIRQSTSSFFQKHYFDDIEIKEYIPDITAPMILSINASTNKQVDILFNETVDITSAQLVSNYAVDNGLAMPSGATIDPVNTGLVHLAFSNAFTNGVTYTLTVNGVKDIEGNAINNAIGSFSFYSPKLYDVVIDELMADPNPVVGLPDKEWIELRNTSGHPINLQGWRIGDLSGVSGIMPSYILQPDSIVIVCTGSAVSELSAFGKVVSTSSFPSLDNEGELIYLTDGNGKTIHALEYSQNWYQSNLKKEGGWSLEMIDTKNPCAGIQNWKASTHLKGGTPGKINSANGTFNEASSPKLIRALVVNETNIRLLFDEPIDSATASQILNYNPDNGLTITQADPLPPLFNTVNITLGNPMNAAVLYSITIKNISDCKGNMIGLNNHAQFGLPQEAKRIDLVINEILFNPRAPGADYVEVYNRSKKIIDLSDVYIANRKSNNEIGTILKVFPENHLFFPGTFVLLSTDLTVLKSQYFISNPDALLKMNSLPSYPDDKGNVVLLNKQGEIIDEVDYSEKWHFPLVSNPEGVSLERMDYETASVQNNFHSAATSAGYGTPGYKNSQSKTDENLLAEIKISPEVFSPDNDGIDDFLIIDYSFGTPGFVANITIFNASGIPVRFLQKNSLSGIKGFYKWDGLGDKNKKLPQGIYIIYTEIFNASGKKKDFKKTVVLARRY